MKIYNNLPAINSFRKLNENNKQMANSMSKLSSGLRINTAKDDAAGLAISEKMRAQIRGLNQASRNAQDTISLIQTAEGGLQETHSLLQRMRELSVQAANDTNVDVDRSEIQKEINELTKEVTRIGNNTEFNTMKLLNRSSVDPTEAEKVISYLKKWWLEEAEKLVKDTYGIEANNIDMKVVIAEDLGNAAAFVRASYQTSATSPTGITGMGQNLELHISLNASRPLDGANPGPYPQYVDRVIAHEMVHAVMAVTMNFGELSIWFKEGTAEAVHGADERLKYAIHNNGGGDTGLVRVLDSIGNGTQGDWAGGQDDYAAAYVAVRYLDRLLKDGGESDGVKAIMTYLTSNPTENLDHALQHFYDEGNITFSNTSGWLATVRNDIKTDADLRSKAFIHLDGVFSPENDTGSLLGLDAGGPRGALGAADVMPDGDFDTATENDQPLVGFNLNWDTAEIKPLTFQIGANHGQSISLNTVDMTANGLGITSVSVLNHASAGQAIKTFDDAIQRVSAYRGYLGAVQNRLEHTINNLNNSAENLSAAESRIRDVDMAKEMMKMTKYNILSQASQSMLAQANMHPQSVLKLLA